MRKITGVIILCSMLFLVMHIRSKLNENGSDTNQTMENALRERYKAPQIARQDSAVFVPVVVQKEPSDKKEEDKPKPQKEDRTIPKPSKRVSMPKVKESLSSISKGDAQTGNGTHSIPNLFARYDMAVSEYLKFMGSRGGKIIVYDVSKDEPVCEVISPLKLRDHEHMGGFSSSSRRITDDYPEKNVLLKSVEAKYGAGSYEILLVLPDKLESLLSERVAEALKGRGLKMDEVTTVFMTYKGNSSSLSVYIEKVTGNFGEREIGAAFKL